MSTVEVVPGDPRSSVVVHVPHSSRVIPPEVRAASVLDDQALELELDRMTDAHTDLVAPHATDLARLDPRLVVNRLSRRVANTIGAEGAGR